MELIDNVLRDVAELPDRNSPEDWPEAMLVTGAELRQIIITHAPAEPVNARLLEALSALLDDIEALIGESAGVYGLHLNGDVSPWSELEEGGRFERLSSMSRAREAIAAAEAAKTLPPTSGD